jgi:hypothetical protein
MITVQKQIICNEMKLTKSNIKKVREYCGEMFPKWRKRYSKNIVGVHLGEKKIQSLKTGEYAIVFHVIQKFGVPVRKIPKKILIKIDGEKIYLPTDVIETGITKLMNVLIGDKAQGLSSLNEFGTIGLFLPLDGIPKYICSNMHVLAPEKVKQKHYYKSISQQFYTDVLCSNENESVKAFLEKGEFDKTDLAIARLQFPDRVTNRIKGIGQPTRLLNDNNLVVGMDVKMFGAKTKAVNYGQIEEVGVSRIVAYDTFEISVSNLVATSIYVQNGDSGSAIVNDNIEVVGILVSKDEIYSYVIPSSKIKSFISNL